MSDGPNIRDDARAALEEWEKWRARENSEWFYRHERNAIELLQNLIRKRLKREVPKDKVTVEWRRLYDKSRASVAFVNVYAGKCLYTSTTIDDLEFTAHDRSRSHESRVVESLCLIGKCVVCGGPVSSENITSLADLGRILDKWNPRCYKNDHYLPDEREGASDE